MEKKAAEQCSVALVFFGSRMPSIAPDADYMVYRRRHRVTSVAERGSVLVAGGAQPSPASIRALAGVGM